MKHKMDWLVVAVVSVMICVAVMAFTTSCSDSDDLFGCGRPSPAKTTAMENIP